MITIIFSLLMIMIFSRVLLFAIRMTWGLLKVVGGLILLPAVIIVFFIKGLLYIAFPVLVIVGIVSLMAPKNAAM